MVLTQTTTAAAKHLGISQSAVSRSIRNLEEQFGKVLFVRTGNRLSPTAEALALNASLDDLFAALAEISGIKRNFVNGRNTLRVAAPPTFAQFFLEEHVAMFSERAKDASIVLDVCNSETLILGVAEGRFDIGITDLQTNHSGIRRIPFRTSNMACVLRHDDLLATKSKIHPSDLDRKPIIALTRRHSIRTCTERIFQTAGSHPNIRISTATTSSAIRFVRMGLGCALVNPFPVQKALGDDLLLRRFLPDCPFLTSIITNASGTRSPIAQAFLRHTIKETPPDEWSEPA